MFKISFPENKQMNRVLELTGREKIIYFKDSITRTEQKTKMGKVINIHNFKTRENYTYTERDADKIAMKATADDMSMIMDMSYMNLPQLKITGETKIIAGYKCTKAVITVNAYGEKKRLQVWYTDEIALPNSPEYSIQGINGYILEFTFYDNTKPMTITCVSVEKTRVPDQLLQVPADYTIRSMPELTKKSRVSQSN